MWPVSFMGLITLAASTVGARGEPAVSQATLPEPIPTRQTLFSIPFRIDRADQPWQEPAEVQLYVSADRGLDWRLYSRVEPSKGHFLFQAGGDGEYWFLIRTLDRSGQLRPQGDTRAGLRVLVDTTPPKLHMEATQGEAGQITAKWQVNEVNLNPHSLKIQYRTAANHPWQFVAIDRKSIRASGATQQGEVTWWPESGSARVEIRAEVTDTAGNPAVTHAQVNCNRSPATSPDLGSTSAAVANSHFRPTGQQPTSTWRASVDSSLPLESQADRPSSTAPGGDPATTGPIRNEADAPDADLADPYAELHALPSEHSSLPVRPPEGSVAIQINPAVRNQYIPAGERTVSTNGEGLPSGECLRMVNTRAFELEYQVESAGPSGIGRVELWGTRDGGQTWSSFGTDNDRQSPFLVTVKEEGIYGFRMAVSNGRGLGGQRPQSGDVPDVWIGVDQTRPYARIVSAEHRNSPPPGQLIIQWEAEDRMLSDRPISLFFSDTPGGPWSSIASELENTGEYAWSVTSRVPQRIYLRLEVRDKAGNLGVFETADAIWLDQPQPIIRIRDVRPLSHSARTPVKRSFLR